VLIVDLEGVPYMDSAELSCLVGLHVSCENGGRKYAFVNVKERVKALTVMTNVDQFLVTRESIADAEASLSG
jgi:anti-anti-sigma factor